MNLHAATSPDCPVCLGHGQVCELHPGLAWGPGLPIGYFPADRVCWCGAGARPCILAVEEPDNDGTKPPTRRRSDLQDMLKWALVAAALTVVFGAVLDVLEAWL
jgi:hypothetical protein